MKNILKLIIIEGGIFLLAVTGCAANGPLIKPDRNTRQGYASQHPELSAEIRQAILEGNVIKGMTKEEVIASWGKPSRTVDFGAETNPSFYDPGVEGWWYKPFPISLEPTRFVQFTKGMVDYTTKDYK